MERVGLDLQTTAFKRKDSQEDLNLFGRSAFNRYYYATFLEVRAMLLRWKAGWKGSHSSVPDELTGWVTDGIATVQKKAVRVADSQAVAICKAARASAADLSRLMKVAYAVRVLADYEPEISIILDGERFRLDRTSITDAHGWLERAKADIAKIDRAWSLFDAF